VTLVHYQAKHAPSNTKQGDGHAAKTNSRIISTYFKEVSRFLLPSVEEERTLFREYYDAPDRVPASKDGSFPGTDGPIAGKIKKKLAQFYLRFVIQQALRRTKEEHILMDLIAAGNEGMLIAIRKFDPSKGTRFLTYGAWWIRVYMQTAIHEIGLGHLPQPPNDIDGSPCSVCYLEDSSQLPDKEIDVEALLSSKQFKILTELHEAELSRRETLIIIYYYGLRNGPSKTFSDISKILLDLEGTYISSERVRQIKENALHTLHSALQEKSLYKVHDII
jgi:RNA polymerase sigma factor (sigma-70 family)